jgi:hypothetical protein
MDSNRRFACSGIYQAQGRVQAQGIAQQERPRLSAGVDLPIVCGWA